MFWFLKREHSRPPQNDRGKCRARLSVELLESREVPAGGLAWAINTTNDTPDANPNDGVPLDAAGKVSLRAAIQQANSTGPINSYTFTFDPVVFAGQKTITLNTALDTFAVNIVLTGTGAQNLTIVGGGTSGVFHISNTSNSRITDLTIRDGVNNANVTDGRGGGVDNRGVLTLENVKVINCQASEEGGGIFSSGNLTLTSCSLLSNRTTGIGQGYGGGLGVGGDPRITITNTEIAYNTSTSRGGGISIRNTAVVNVTNSSSIHDNNANYAGGVYNSAATFSMSGGSIRANQATMDGGGLMQSGGSSTLTGVAIESNSANGKCGGIYAAAGLANAVQLNSCVFGVNSATQAPQVGEGAAGIVQLIDCFGITQDDVMVV